MPNALISNFSEILSSMEEKFPFLVKLGRDAEACLNSDNISCLVYLERMGRAMIRLIYKRYNLFTDFAENDINITQENLQLLKDRGIINTKTFNKFKTVIFVREDDNAKNLIQIVIPLCNQLNKIYESEFDFLNEKFPVEVVNYLHEAESKLYSDTVSFFINLENACEEAIKFIIINQNLTEPVVSDIRDKYDLCLKILRRDRIIKEQSYSTLCDVKKARNNFAHIGAGDFMLEDKEKISLLQRVKTLFKFFSGLITLNTKPENINPTDSPTDSPTPATQNQTQIPEDLFAIYETGTLQEISERDFNVNDTLNTTTPLMRAAKRNNADVVNFLISKGADVNAKNKKGWTALLFAASQNTSDVVKLLLDNGADINAKNKDGNNAIICALEHAPRENVSSVVNVLVRYGADKNAVSKNGRKAINYIKNALSDNDFIKLCAKGNIKEIDLAFKNGANINALSKDNSTALMWAARFNNSDVVNYLINKGANINSENLKGRTAFDFASVNENLTDSDALLTLKYKTDKEFLKLCKSAPLDEIKNAINNGSNVNSKSKDNSTALMFAARFNSEDVVKFLIENGANISFKNNNGRNALYFARANNKIISPDILHLLENTQQE